MNVQNQINSKFLKEIYIILQRGAEQESSCGVGIHWASQHLGGHHSFTLCVFLGPHTLLGGGTWKWVRQKGQCFHRINKRRDNKACDYNRLKSGFTEQAKDAVKAYDRVMLVQGPVEVRLIMKSIRQVKEHLCLCTGGKGRPGEYIHGRRNSWKRENLVFSKN